MVEIQTEISNDLFNRVMKLIPEKKRPEWSPDAFEEELARIAGCALEAYLSEKESLKDVQSHHGWVLREFTEEGRDVTLRHEFEYFEEFVSFLVQNYELFKRAKKGNRFILTKI